MSADSLPCILFAHLTRGALHPPVAPSALYWGAILLLSSLLKSFYSATSKGRKLPEQSRTAKHNLMLEQSVFCVFDDVFRDFVQVSFAKLRIPE